MKLRRTLVTMLVVLMACSLLAACGGGADQAKIDSVNASWNELVADQEEVVALADTLPDEQRNEVADDINSISDAINEMSDIINEEGGFAELSEEDLDAIQGLVDQSKPLIATVKTEIERLIEANEELDALEGLEDDLDALEDDLDEDLDTSADEDEDLDTSSDEDAGDTTEEE